jgi:phage terminase large subunit-like protein
MSTLRYRIRRLQERMWKERNTIDEIGKKNACELTEGELSRYLCSRLGRSVAEFKAMSDKEWEQVANRTLEGSHESNQATPHSGQNPVSAGSMLTSPQAASELLRRRCATNEIQTYFPDTGPLRRELYPKHREFFSKGKKYPERLFLAANRVGKTTAGAYETTLHLTGKYPSWWEGRRFDRPIKAWVAGDTSKTVREILQEVLLGPFGQYGTGMIPGDLLLKVTRKQNIAETVDTIYVRHVSGGMSVLRFKSFQEGRKSFQGADLDFVWLDEEAPLEIYVECLVRLMTRQGAIILTFTPLQGLTELVLQFLPGGKLPVAAEAAGPLA